MAELLIITAAFAVLYRALARLEPAPATIATAPLTPPSPKANRLSQLTTYADRLYAEKKWLAAEKAYLSVLKLDHKNVTAYNHLGVIYSTQKNLPDAIECFQIATRLHPSGVTYQNLGLAYFDNRNLIKSIASFQKSLMFEPTAARYIALSRSQAKLGNTTDAVSSLEAAVELEPGNKRTLQLLAEACAEADRPAAARATYRRILELDPNDLIAAKRLNQTQTKPLK